MITADLYFTADALDFLTNRNKKTENIIREALLTCDPFLEKIFDELVARYHDRKEEIEEKVEFDENVLKYFSYDIEDIDIDEAETREMHKAGYIGRTAFYMSVDFDDNGFMNDGMA